jgi:hypothetical protein
VKYEALIQNIIKFTHNSEINPFCVKNAWCVHQEYSLGNLIEKPVCSGQAVNFLTVFLQQSWFLYTWSKLLQLLHHVNGQLVFAIHTQNSSEKSYMSIRTYGSTGEQNNSQHRQQSNSWHHSVNPLYLHTYVSTTVHTGIKGKVVLLRSTEVLWDERRYSSYSFLTSVLEWGEWSASCPAMLYPLGKDPQYSV